MEALLFFIYLVVFVWLVNRIPFFKKSGLTPFWLTAFFSLKVAAGVAYGIFYTTIPNYMNEADTWRFFFDSHEQSRLIFNNPLKFLAEFFDNPYGKAYRHFFSSHNSFWNDLRHLYMVKFVAIMNIFSGGRYYINVIFYSFITFFGPIAFIRVMKDVFKGKLAIIAGTTFMIPSFIFWTSGIHKDGIVFLIIGLVTYHCYRFFNNQTSSRAIIYSVLLLLLLFPLRNYVFLALIPALISWWWASKISRYPWIPFLIVTILGSLLFFTTKYIHPKINLPIAVVMRNKDFIQLGGNSMLPQPTLEANFNSFVRNAPIALNHVLARPYLGESMSVTYFLSALEITSIWLLLIIWFFRYSNNPFKNPVVVFLAMTSLTLLLLTGYIVPQIGAIVRYRSIYLPLLVVPLMCTIQWKKHIK